ncbi:MAG: phosphatase PAP2 family protein [Bacteroidota bacterium]|jgi:membrane-associated phospholipid phosphatase
MKLNLYKRESVLKFNLREILSLADIFTLLMLGIYTLLAIIFYPKIKDASNLILQNVLISFTVISISTVTQKMNAGSLFIAFRKLYVIPVIFLIYSQVQHYIAVINPHDYDNILIAWDRAIFGTDPTKFFQKISYPVLTEYFQLAYMTYFIMPFIHGIEIHFRKSNEEFNHFAAILLFSFYTSYLLYFFFPAIGPRFTLHEFANLPNELPGLWLTDFFRNIIDTGGGIIQGTAYPSAHVNRDCMPSGHTYITTLNMYIAYRFKSRLRYPIYIFGISLIIATVYLRYHYVVDILAGLACAYGAIKIEPKIRKLFLSKGFELS